MLKQDLIQRTEEFLRRRFDSASYFASYPDAKAYRLGHTYRVANIGHEIALKEGLDETEMVIACLLHDISYCEEFQENGWIEHGRRSAQIARPFLIELGIAENRINDICYGIAIHVDDKADFPGEKTAFALSVGDADNIDRFDAYRIHEALSNDGFLGKSLTDKTAYAHKRLERLRELKEIPMATRTAKAMWETKLAFYIAYYEKLAAQLKSSKGLTSFSL
jgi:Predicted HD superfamily hydrolase